MTKAGLHVSAGLRRGYSTCMSNPRRLALAVLVLLVLVVLAVTLLAKLLVLAVGLGLVGLVLLVLLARPTGARHS